MARLSGLSIATCLVALAAPSSFPFASAFAPTAPRPSPLTGGYVPLVDLSSPVASSPLLRASSSSSSSLTSEQIRAREAFSLFDADGTNGIDQSELAEMLRMLDIDATDDEALALFRYLDADDTGSIQFDDFLPWYSEAAETAKESASTFQGIIRNRRTVHKFDEAPVDDDVLERAIRCAISAPNRLMTEPWRFVSLGPQTVEKVAKLNRDRGGTEGSFTRWTKIPGWCVVTCRRSPDDPDVEAEDFKSTCCAVQNFMLSMWSEGIGSKWTYGPVQRTEEFAELCGIDTDIERVAGVVWYGFASGGLTNADPKCRTKGVKDVLTSLP